MLCKQCGQELRDGAIFCTNCGAKVVFDEPIAEPVEPVEQETPVESVEQVEQADSVEPTPYASPAQPMEPVAPAAPPQDDLPGVLSKLASSPIFLIAAISYTLTAVLNLVSLLQGVSPLAALSRLLYQINPELGYLFSDSLRDIDPHFLQVFWLVVVSVPTLLTVAGIWTAFGTVKARKKTVVGHSIIRVVTIITMIIFCIYLLISASSILSEARSYYSYSYYFYSSDANNAYFVTCAVSICLILAVLIIGLIYFVKTLKTINVMQCTIADEYPVGNVSLFVAVIQMLIGSIALFGLWYFFRILTGIWWR